MSEKTKRSRCIYTVNEKTTVDVQSNATSPTLTEQTEHETTTMVIQRTEDYKTCGDFNKPPIYRGCKKIDYTPEWRKVPPQVPSVGSFGDFDRGSSMMDVGFPNDMLYSVKQHEQTMMNEMISSDFVKPGMGIATPHGTMSLRLRNDIKVDITMDSSIRLINKRNSVVIALNPYGCISAFIHPHGRIHQNGSKVEMLIHDNISGNNKNAKFWYKGVSFKSDFSALVYLVDAAGTRSTTDAFRDLTPDFSLSVFYDEARHGPMFVQEAVSTLQKATYRMTDTGVEHWRIKDINITQSGDIVNVYRHDTKYSLKITGDSSTAMLSTPFIHCTASSEHMFVRRGDRRMHFDGANFIVRNAGHSAGFDEENSLKLF